ncbi:class I SAM-dependent methyltransferase [Actinophytocola sp.]|uniref:class I SAM-dependent methyltransferase n=1 Tax=Actinophytocola sp. TaxID=1872138 RepID=UPI002ED14706
MAHHVHWLSNRHPRPAHLVVAGDDLRADRALTLVRRGRAVLWRGDYRNARQLLAAMRRRLDRRPVPPGDTPAETFHRHRAVTADRARLLNRLVLELGPGYRIDLPHAPDVSLACRQAYGPDPGPALVPLAELLGVLGAHQWRARGVLVPALDATIHPHYGVFAPTRQDYVQLVADAPWPGATTAFDVGTGTGVLAALLARRGAGRVVATDIEPRAVACARDNTRRLGLTGRIEVRLADLFPAGRADLVVCNPPWLPATPAAPLDAAVYDPESRVLRRFLHEVSARLTPGGEAWLVLSDLAERLGLRRRGELTGMFADARLTVVDRLDTRPRPRRRADSLSVYRAAEITSLWRLSAASSV